LIIEYNDFPKLIECLKEIQYLFNKSLAENKEYTHENNNPKPHTDDGSHGDAQTFETSY